MNVVFLSPADKELEEAINFYNDQLNGLGDKFYDDVVHALNLIIAFPDSWQKVGGNSHKCILKSFPYIILFVIEKERILITAVAHQHRHPKSYLKNIK